MTNIAFLILFVWWLIGSIIIILLDAKMNKWVFFARIKPRDIPLMILFIIGSWITIVYFLFTKNIM